MASKAGGNMQQEQQADKSDKSTRHLFTAQRFSPVGLIIARVVWVLFTLCILVLFVSSPASEYAHLQMPCHNPNCDVGQITVANVVALHRMGLSIPLYALYPLISGLVVGGILFLVSFVIFWRRSDQWFPFFVSLWLLIFAQSGLVGPDSSLFSPQVMSVI